LVTSIAFNLQDQNLARPPKGSGGVETLAGNVNPITAQASSTEVFICMTWVFRDQKGRLDCEKNAVGFEPDLNTSN